MHSDKPTYSELETFFHGFCRDGGMREPDRMETVEPPPVDQVRRSLVELCERSELREPDRIEEQDDGDLIAFWDEEKLAIVVEMDPLPAG